MLKCQICPLPDASDLLRAYPKSFHPGSSSGILLAAIFYSQFFQKDTILPKLHTILNNLICWLEFLRCNVTMRLEVL